MWRSNKVHAEVKVNSTNTLPKPVSPSPNQDVFVHADFYSYVGVSVPNNEQVLDDNGLRRVLPDLTQTIDNTTSRFQVFLSLQHLLTIPAWITTQNQNYTPLQIAIIEKNKYVVKRLLEAGASPKVDTLHHDDDLYDKLQIGIQYFIRDEGFEANYFRVFDVPDNSNSHTALTADIGHSNKMKGTHLDPEKLTTGEHISNALVTEVPTTTTTTTTASNNPPSRKNSMKYELHTACKIGDIDAILIHLVSSNKDEEVWLRDDFDNLPVYYSLLHGHTLSCAWLMLAMGSLARLDRLELERFERNALHASIKQLLQGKIPPQEVVRRKEEFSRPESSFARETKQACGRGNNAATADEGGDDEDMGIGGLFGDS